MPTTQNIQEIIEIIRSAGIYEGADAALRLTVSFLASFPAQSAPAEHAVRLGLLELSRAIMDFFNPDLLNP